MKVQFHTETQVDPKISNFMNVIYGSAKRGGYRLRWYLLLLLIISPILYLAYFMYQSIYLTIAPGIITTSPMLITATNDGIIDFVANGDELYTKKSVLVTINNETISNTEHYLSLKTQEIDAQIEKLPAINLDKYNQEIKNAKSSFLKVNEIKKLYEKYRKQGQVSQVEYANIINTASVAKQRELQSSISKEQALFSYDQNKLAGPLMLLRNDIGLKLISYQSQKNELSIVSPVSGFIVENYVTEGQWVQKGQELMNIAPNRQPEVISYVDAKYLAKVAKGSEVMVQLPNGGQYSAIVRSKPRLATKLPSQLTTPFTETKAVLKVVLEFNNHVNDLDWVEGMPVKVII
ncbi:permease [Photobacterium damselae subsp. damselae]|uniref:HlyD family secretion protein n=1 Tax=Photobacterium damselae TaxID=38293 RepID=UPI0021FDF940|nr:HlyD family efflux transporter periplasmic adaptor subunit [Photobacterium damselae]BDR34180.1 permease [Photobacterium damselae subsp. damselae]